MKNAFRTGSQCARSLAQRIRLATMRKRLIALLVLVVLACTVTFSTTSYAERFVGRLAPGLMQKKRPAPKLTADKGTYLPGETITLSGTNWVPGEGVTIVINSDTSPD